jgi:hypothetical protein
MGNRMLIGGIKFECPLFILCQTRPFFLTFMDGHILMIMEV